MYDPNACFSSELMPLDDATMKDLSTLLEESFGESTELTSEEIFKERRREAHSLAEQKRRDSIKLGYEMLEQVVPNCKPMQSNSYKVSRATVLQKSIDYIRYLKMKNREEEKERNTLRKDVNALKIMLANYQKIINSQQLSTEQCDPNAGEMEKCALFQEIMDVMFETFEPVPVSNFAEFSAGVFTWLEQYCKPQFLGAVVEHALTNHAPFN